MRRALERAELVVVQEAFATTATARYADWLLPATSWGEKDGTVTNSERCISRVRPAVPAPGQTRHDWSIAVALAQRLEARLRPGAATLFPYPTAESVWLEHRESTRGRDLDITGLSYPMLDARGPQQWPLREGETQGRARLYAEGCFETDDGRARFFDTPFVPLAEPRDARYPISLTTGRLRDQWHGMSRTGTLGRLFGHQAEPTIDLAPQDMQRLGLKDGDLVQLDSRRGSLVLPARASDTVAPTQAHVAMHWGDEVLGGQAADGSAGAGINALTNPAFCPKSKQPELKHTAIPAAESHPALASGGRRLDARSRRAGAAPAAGAGDARLRLCQLRALRTCRTRRAVAPGSRRSPRARGRGRDRDPLWPGQRPAAGAAL